MIRRRSREQIEAKQYIGETNAQKKAEKRNREGTDEDMETEKTEKDREDMEDKLNPNLPPSVSRESSRIISVPFV